MAGICKFSFNVAAWNIVCNKILTAKDWQQGEAHWQLNATHWADFIPKLAFLSPLKRRRLSESARLFFEATWDLVGTEADIPVVFASTNGELNRNFALWQSLLQEGDVSPTSFSLSVHNALVGQWSELRQVKAESTAIMAQKDNFETALMEGFLLLNEGHKKVLVVALELPLDKQFNVHPIIRQPFGYALALVLEQGSQYQVSLFSEAERDQLATDNGLEWVKNQHLARTEWKTYSSAGGYWLWQKN